MVKIFNSVVCDFYVVHITYYLLVILIFFVIIYYYLYIAICFAIYLFFLIINITIVINLFMLYTSTCPWTYNEMLNREIHFVKLGYFLTLFEERIDLKIICFNFFNYILYGQINEVKYFTFSHKYFI